MGFSLYNRFSVDPLWAFTLRNEEESNKMWSQIPEGTDIVMTHGPPKGILGSGKMEDV